MRRFDRREGDEPPPKPYAFVPLSAKGAARRKPEGHHLYKEGLLTGNITGTLVARSPVHVASGNIELTGGSPSLVKAHFSRNGRPTIPGSSLKGAVRSIVEAISEPPSCLRVTKIPPRELPPDFAHCAKKESLCLACRMFGAMGYLGQVRFSDSVLERGATEVAHMPVLHQPGRYEPERVYFEDGRVRGRKFYKHGQAGRPASGNVPVEVCPAGSSFGLAVHFENLEAAHLALLLTALGQGQPRLLPKLGGGKPSCCGSVEIRGVAVTLLPARAAALDFEPEAQPVNLEEVLAATQTINRERLERLAEIFKYPGERDCPDGSY